MMKIFARQGDLVVRKLEEDLSKDSLVERQSVTFAGGSSGHRHRIVGAVLVVQGSDPVRFRTDEPRELVHEKTDGHRTIALPPGSYEVSPLRERGDGNDRKVED